MGIIQLIQTQLALECMGLDQDGLLICTPGPNPDEIARVYVFQYEGGYTLYFRRDLPPSIRERISALGPETAFRNQGAVKTLLAEDRPCTKGFVGQSYLFPDTLGHSQFPDVVRLTEVHRLLVEAYHPGLNVTDRAIYAIIRDGMIVSTCESARENEQAGEAYVYTAPECRRRSYGRQVTAAWAHHLQKQGKIAFYSHALGNPASRAVAQSLKLRPCFALVNYG